MLTVVADEPHLGSPAPHQTAQQTKEDPLELVAEDAVDDEVDGAVDGDEKVVGLSERMILMTKMLQQKNDNKFSFHPFAWWKCVDIADDDVMVSVFSLRCHFSFFCLSLSTKCLE